MLAYIMYVAIPIIVIRKLLLIDLALFTARLFFRFMHVAQSRNIQIRNLLSYYAFAVFTNTLIMRLYAPYKTYVHIASM